jgi:hypothetical protein
MTSEFVIAEHKRVTYLHRSDCREIGAVFGAGFRRLTTASALRRAQRMYPAIDASCGCLDGHYPWTPQGHGPTRPGITWDAAGHPIWS